MEQKQTNLGHKMSWFFSAMCCKIICQIVAILYFWNKRFMLDEMPRQNTFLAQNNPFFVFSFRANSSFLKPKQWISWSISPFFIKYEYSKKEMWIFVLQKCGKFWSIFLEYFLSERPSHFWRVTTVQTKMQFWNFFLKLDLNCDHLNEYIYGQTQSRILFL